MVGDRLLQKICSIVENARRGGSQKGWIDVVRELIRIRDISDDTQ